MSFSFGGARILVLFAALAGCRVEAHQVKSDGPRSGSSEPTKGASEPPKGTNEPAKPGAPCTRGATAPAADNCNTCSCPEGVWACTEKLCSTDAEPPKEPPCGGIAGFRCPPNTYCAWGRFQKCGRGDAMASCKPRPEVCTEEFKPVCGCDGQDYGNVCAAARAGTGVLKDGPCK